MTKSPQTISSEQGNSFTKKVGTTTYIVSVHYPKEEKETVRDKLLRIIQADIAKGDKAC